ncbi:hypothetical protein NW767_15827 [Fusarium falciforme]|nr:hypothetical protein NW767_15827 [Fusarium falciforme]
MRRTCGPRSSEPWLIAVRRHDMPSSGETPNEIDSGRARSALSQTTVWFGLTLAGSGVPHAAVAPSSRDGVVSCPWLSNRCCIVLPCVEPLRKEGPRHPAFGGESALPSTSLDPSRNVPGHPSCCVRRLRRSANRMQEGCPLDPGA